MPRGTPSYLAVGMLALATAAIPVGAAVRFRDAGDSWNLRFRHHHGGSGARYMVETMCGGVAVFDFDADGDEDVFWVDGGVLPGYEGPTPRSRLSRNDGGRFVDVTGASGIAVASYGCGAAAGDVDGDGDVDLYVTALGPNRLFRNLGDGRFEEIGSRAGVADPAWSASAAFADVDRDGALDLYVASYVDFTLADNRFCGDRERGIRTYCHPGAYDGVSDRLYRNRGDGTFEDRTEAMGLGGRARAGLGVAFGTWDDDPWPDLYVANDAEPNLLFLGHGGETFEDLSLLSGSAYSNTGSPEAGMGLAVGDYDRDGRDDLFVTNFELETNALYRATGGGLFVDARNAAGVAEPSLTDLGFGAVAEDFDLDGDLDLFVANGHILDNASAMNPSSRYRQRNKLYENDGSGRFRSVDAGLDAVRASRGAASGDFDLDGDPDVVVVNSNDASEVYENLAGGDWIAIDLQGTGSNRFGIGSRVRLASESSQVREVRRAGSYLSQSAPTLIYGLGPRGAPSTTLEVRWSRGEVQRYRDLPPDRRYRLVEGPLDAAREAARASSSGSPDQR